MIRSILWVCTVSVVAVGCAAPPVDAPATQIESAGRPSEDRTQTHVLADDVQETMVARWRGFQALARQRQNGEVLAIELIRTRQDESVAVSTVVENRQPRRYVVVGDARGIAYPIEQQAEALAAAASHEMVLGDTAVDPGLVTLPPHQPGTPGTPGIIATVETLLIAAFSHAELDEAIAPQTEVRRPANASSAAEPGATAQVTPEALHNLLVARWEGFKRLAKTLPNHQILAVEIIRTANDETAAAFTVVRNGVPIRYVVKRDARGQVKSPTVTHRGEPCHMPDKIDDLNVSEAHSTEARAATNSTDPASLTLGAPPPQEPGTPGIVALGNALLSTAFDVGEMVTPSGK